MIALGVYINYNSSHTVKSRYQTCPMTGLIAVKALDIFMLWISNRQSTRKAPEIQQLAFHTESRKRNEYHCNG